MFARSALRCGSRRWRCRTRRVWRPCAWCRTTRAATGPRPSSRQRNATIPDAVASITEFLTGLGYTGYFDIDGVRRPVEEFDAAEHQNPDNIGGWQDGWQTRGVYVNNFAFLPKE